MADDIPGPEDNPATDDAAGAGENPGMPLEDLSEAAAAARGEEDASGNGARTAAELEAVYDVPVQISAVLGHADIEVSNLLKLDEGAVIELDRKVGEAIDIYVNDRLVARGEVVIVENRLGITMTEIIKSDRA
jgi:flagellar motor switch protein FliN/FliY